MGTVRKLIIPIVAALLVSTIGCDKAESDKTGEPSASKKASAAADEGKFALELKVSGTQDVYTLEGAPKPEEVQKRLADAIIATPAFAKDGTRKVAGLVTYDVKVLPDGAGHDLVLLGGINSSDANFSAGVNLRSTDETWKGKSIGVMVDAAIAQFATRIGAQARVLGGSEDDLGEILSNAEEPHDAKLMAIQEIRERRVTKHLMIVRGYLAAEHAAELRMAASATLASLGDTESRPQIIKVAEDFSRDRDPQYVPMLHILGDIGGAEVVTYLEAVSDGHSAPAVRAVAGEALKKARAVPSGQQ